MNIQRKPYTVTVLVNHNQNKSVSITISISVPFVIIRFGTESISRIEFEVL